MIAIPMSVGGTTLERPVSPWPVRLFNRGAAVLNQTGLRTCNFTAAGLIAKVRDRHGLDDFGPGDFSEPLSKLLAACRDEANLNLVGRFALEADTLQCLRNRLLLERDRATHPAMQNEKISSPVFIVGLPRTGTTILHTLLAADPQHRIPLTWQVMEPSPLGNIDERARVRRVDRNLRSLNWLAPAFTRLHAVGARLPQECVSIMSLSFLSDQFDTMYNIPSYRSWYLRQSFVPAYECHRRFLQHLQFRTPARRWILKAPAHMFAVRDLLQVYPDARFIQAHRAPLDAVTSVSSLVAMLRRIFSDQIDPIRIGQEALVYWAEATERFLAQRDQLSRDSVCDLSYAEIKRDPLGAVAKIYDYFGWTLSSESAGEMKRLLASQPADQTSYHRYHPSQFGLNPDQVEELFGEYCSRFHVPISETGHGTKREDAPRSVRYSLGDNSVASEIDLSAADERSAALG